MDDVLNPPTDAVDRIDAWCLGIAFGTALGLLAIGFVAWVTM